ncbi:MAG: adenylate kinase [Candidatus Methanocomedens sp.]|jgi:adenylate kinase|nr:MAG: adenylate kinase [ANME-2 cluster archaeon]
MVNLVLLGAPGAGKGTQAKMLAGKYGILHISTGDILRENVSNNTELGKKAKEYMDKGELVPDTVLIDIIKDRLSKPDTDNGFLLDGYPRTIPQAVALDYIFGQLGKRLDVVIDIKVQDEELVARLAGRRMCKCGASYHVKFNPPKRDGICDVCSLELYQRDDDTESSVKTRLVAYYNQTHPLIDYYTDKGLLRTVSGTGDIEDIFGEITVVIDKILE